MAWNIRELENIIERAINLCDSNIITLSDLPSYLNNSNDLTETTFEIDENNILTFEEYEKKIIETALRKYKKVQ